MTAWPASFPQTPLVNGYTQTTHDSTIRTAMGYGPDKLRRRTTTLIKHVTMRFVLTATELDTLMTFYNTTIAGVGEVDWIDHTSTASPQAAATYRFLSPPNVAAIDVGQWSVTLALELVP